MATVILRMISISKLKVPVTNLSPPQTIVKIFFEHEFHWVLLMFVY